ncbi:type IV secretory system conjugative DNA transfer family protein [Streptomyces sp. NPDC052013]|uniref:type IV secretory system conjugative DNA transfer family protein n=1 Tax=Streptomyces sp. NPDC052013 TaxID=3365679 RepID=UPI0037D6D4F4
MRPHTGSTCGTTHWTLRPLCPPRPPAGEAEPLPTANRRSDVAQAVATGPRSTRATLRADVLRPSLDGVKRRSISPHDLGLNLGTDLLYRRALFLACEDLVLMYAPPRMGKSAQLGNAVIDAAGSVVVTSTRGDLYENTHKLRREHNRPVWVFNAGVSGVPNTLRWNLVEGCEDASAAIRRAGYILAASASGEDRTTPLHGARYHRVAVDTPLQRT